MIAPFACAALKTLVKPRLPSRISGRAVEAVGREHRRQHAVIGGLPRMQRLAVAAAVLLHAGGLRAGDAERVRHLLAVQSRQPRRSGGRSDRPERARQMPAAEMMARCGLSCADARFERHRQRHGHIAARRFPPLAEREQSGQGGGARVQDHAAQMRVVEIEHMAHLAVRDRRIEEPELLSAMPQHGDLGRRADLVVGLHQDGDGRVRASRERTARPVEHRAFRLVHRGGRQILVAHRR